MKQILEPSCTLKIYIYYQDTGSDSNDLLDVYFYEMLCQKVGQITRIGNTKLIF